MQPDQPARILLADDQADVLAALRLLLRSEGFDTDGALSVQDVRARLDAAPYDLLLMDLNYARDTTSGREGLELLAEVHARDPLLPVVVMTGWGSIETAVEAMRRGARTFVHKPWDNAALADTVRREVEDGLALRAAGRSAEREQRDAQEIQRALLPCSEPDVAGCAIAARWRPASAFGGDFYDIVRIDGSRVAISIGDVCGKGLPAALMMANVQAWTRARAASDLSPCSLTGGLNRQLARIQALRRFVTFFYAVYDTVTHRLTFTNAGHNPPLVVRADGSLVRLTAGGMVLGAFDTAPYDEGTVVLAPGDRVVFFTDGITEARGAADDEFGDDRLVAAVLRHCTASASQVADAILDEAAAFAAGGFGDDATLLVVEVQ